MSARLAFLRKTSLLLLVLAAMNGSPITAAAAGSDGEDDVRCLRDLKQSLGDPNGRLSWDFSNTTTGFVCNFVGVSCWNPQENRILSLSLSSMSLTGDIPSDLRFCSSANSLDLSGNSLSGSIPSSLCEWLPYLVNLDLSGNSLSGPIPPELSNCSFLNSLDLSSNSLTGQIPPSLSRLDRLKRLDLSSNRLTGEIPPSLASSFPSASVFSSNDGLCGHPVSSRCGSSSHTRTELIIIIAAGVFGAAASIAIAYFVWRCYFAMPKQRRLESGDGDEGRWWAERLRSSHNRLVPVSLFQKPIVKVKLADLMTATGDFHPDHIVTAGNNRAGTSYKAVLPDGSALTIKRLHACSLGEKQFRSEMSRIGELRHPNLVPLLGFCIVEDERLLVYKHMPGGALSSLIQSPFVDDLNWPDRLLIGIGAAHSLAWLHHGFQIPLVHQNITSSAVLLDEDYEARITDFGLARLVKSSPADADAEATFTTPFMSGGFAEFGYVPPEYASNPMATTKGDVFSFGVVLLELVTGQKATEISSDSGGEGFKGNLVDWVSQLATAGRMLDSVDKSLRGKGKEEEILGFLRIALSCVAYNPRERPSMYNVYQSLKTLGKKYESSEQIDEFPLVYNTDD
ncbi:putative inactive receptor kinase [Apostasia shenzhenica]|uniref:Putative inactive receptor kinase n=1 Tax=Apostasia shenzhenica TaxID=1088818 RepID=A0A2I0AQH2_9ASPA|nr:putative inactive receptor kinase [Apostasia shenzhenica]